MGPDHGKGNHHSPTAIQQTDHLQSEHAEWSGSFPLVRWPQDLTLVATASWNMTGDHGILLHGGTFAFGSSCS